VKIKSNVVKIGGSIATSGKGPLSGPGSPPNETYSVGWGGSYGGSGGRPEGGLNGSFSTFTNTPSQVTASSTLYLCNVGFVSYSHS
jgi:hypothetical protein